MMKATRIVFRADASVHLGTGHVMRCLTLAAALRVRGAECRFVCREHAGNLLEEIRRRGFVAHSLPMDRSDGASEQSGPKASVTDCDCITENWESDVSQTAAAISEMDADWLIVDHYRIDSRWERRMGEHARRLMVIDDLADRLHFCDLLLDQNYEDEARYRNLVTGNCRLLLGPRYALLRDEFAERRSATGRQDKAINRILVFFGGSDPLDLTGATLKALSIPGLNHLHVDLVVGANYLHSDALNRLAAIRGRTMIHGPRLHLADLMAVADIAVGAGGVTNWERMCIGLPSLVITLADNQIPVSEILDRLGVIRLLGKSEEVTVGAISEALFDEMRSHKIGKHRNLAMKLCDGLGVERVVNAMREVG